MVSRQEQADLVTPPHSAEREVSSAAIYPMLLTAAAKQPAAAAKQPAEVESPSCWKHTRYRQQEFDYWTIIFSGIFKNLEESCLAEWLLEKYFPEIITSDRAPRQYQTGTTSVPD